MKTAPKMVKREMVLKLRWKIWGIDFTSPGAANVAHGSTLGDIRRRQLAPPQDDAHLIREWVRQQPCRGSWRPSRGVDLLQKAIVSPGRQILGHRRQEISVLDLFKFSRQSIVHSRQLAARRP